eukprot:12196.XXX_730399_730509_1 [CDS] Oithona nana genome sequencing.
MKVENQVFLSSLHAFPLDLYFLPFFLPTLNLNLMKS